MAAEPEDLVLSYSVSFNGVEKDSDRRLREALEKGYRVVDVQMAAGGSGTGGGFVCVTAVLTRTKAGVAIPYRHHDGRELTTPRPPARESPRGAGDRSVWTPAGE